MKKIFFYIIICVSIISCQKNETKFFDLKKHSGEGVFDRGNNAGKKFAYQSVLIENAPVENSELIKLFIKYENENLKKIYKQSDLYSISIFFYNKNSSTSYFVENADDPGGSSSEILHDYYEKFGIGEITIDRCENDNNKWTSKISYFDYQRNIKDTIIKKCTN
ncbi:hypothetical protein IRZ71_10820 [Flavobacterium sp. ANB]|uniref:hypothetical protein n=1 Tax=unclassified Flavobacterium TaxID=196869 RepID=UPI0012B6CA24|nr:MULTISPECIES: hypothetical protein [unclassified Flavobacterium]MBF4516842.1 hypothetical protein [Flavobacterium sp. ANB]MTD69262.1 hypothetical protein [Flavobacterium sp. LC2016-13]